MDEFTVEELKLIVELCARYRQTIDFLGRFGAGVHPQTLVAIALLEAKAAANVGKQKEPRA